MKERLIEILLTDDIINSINNNLDELLQIVPEIKEMIGFNHNHPHHHLNVWNHTLLALSLSPNDFYIRLVLLLHDIGKPHSYQDLEVRHFKNHAEKSFEISKIILDRLNFSEEEKSIICCLIRFHDTPINDEFILHNKELVKKLYIVQYCDAMAHNPTKLEKRKQYLLRIKSKIYN